MKGIGAVTLVHLAIIATQLGAYPHSLRRGDVHEKHLTRAGQQAATAERLSPDLARLRAEIVSLKKTAARRRIQTTDAERVPYRRGDSLDDKMDFIFAALQDLRQEVLGEDDLDDPTRARYPDGVDQIEDKVDCIWNELNGVVRGLRESEPLAADAITDHYRAAHERLRRNAR